MGEWADGIITVHRPFAELKEVVDAFRKNGGGGKPIYLKVQLSFAKSEEEALQGVGTGGGYLFASYLKDASTKIYQYTYDGKLVREVKLPGIGSASGFGGEKEYKEFFYTFFFFQYPAFYLPV